MKNMMSYADKFILVYQDENFLDGKLYFPVINERLKTVQYYESDHFGGMNNEPEPFTVLWRLSFLIANKQYVDYPNSFCIRQKINEIIDYVGSLDIEKIPDLYSVYEGGYFQSRPGRDDHFLYTKNRLCESSDIYLNQLTKIGSEIINYDSCIGRDEADFSNINIEETELIRSEIRNKYDTAEHLIYLISDYLTKIDKIHKDIKKINDLLLKFIKEGDECIFEQGHFTLSQWISFIASFNNGKNGLFYM